MSKRPATQTLTAAAVRQELTNLRNHLLDALGSAALLSGELQTADEVAAHIRTACKLLSSEDADED